LTRLISVALLLALAPLCHAAEDALAEVNAARAARGLPPFTPDPNLTAAAQSAADYRARFRIAGHVTGGMGDFAFLPPGTSADSAGCGALEPSWGWGTCCTYENYQYAGAAVTWGADGRRYMHLFVRGGRGGSGWGMAAQPTWASTSYYGGQTVSRRRGLFRR
jgi:hypothetical protein